MQPAIDLAREGFPIHPYLFGEMYTFMAPIGRCEQAREMYMPDGRAARLG